MTIAIHTHMQPGIARANDGPAFNVFGHSVIFKHTSEELSGNAFVWEIVSPVGTIVPPHIHSVEDEFIYVQDGELEVMIGGQTYRAKAGDLLKMPKHVPHGIQQVGNTPTRSLWIVTPAGKMDLLFAALGALPPGPPDPVVVGRIFAEHDIELLPPPGL
ncbi:MAG: cupin domain-containing protein [Kouleothrix sp.]|jgi:quercetin dioxygenase-like cupin family protein|nr:cupin domain-containing protein [Kouleothrix sp.]